MRPSRPGRGVRRLTTLLFVFATATGPAAAGPDEPQTRPPQGSPAQRPPAPRAPARPARLRWLTVTAGAVRADGTLAQLRTPEIYVETAEFRSRYQRGSGPTFGASAGFQVKPRLAVMAGVSHSRSSAVLEVEARVPHPTRFNQPREASTRTEADRSTFDVDLTGALLVRPRPRVLATLGGGLSFSRVSQHLDAGQTLTEQFPFETVTLRTITLVRESATGVGGHLAADITWMLTRRLGVAGDLRWRLVTPAVAGADRQVEVPAGGLSIRGGVHLRF